MTFFETAGQARCFLLLWGAGFSAALMYDGFRFLRSRCPRWLGAAWDFFWCLCLCALCALALAAGGEQKPRLYALLGLCCGAAVYCLGPRAACAAILKWGRRRDQQTKKRVQRSENPVITQAGCACSD